MTRMLDGWHDHYHTTPDTRDLECPYCRDEIMADEDYAQDQAEQEQEATAWLLAPESAEREYLRSMMQGDRLEDEEV